MQQSRNGGPVPSPRWSFAALATGLPLLVLWLGSAAVPGPARAQAVVDGGVAGDSVVIEAGYLAEAESLLEDPRVQRAFRIIEETREASHQDLIRLTEIPAPPFQEEERARAYAEMLRQAGADSVWIDAEGNVIALRRGTDRDRTVAVDGHLDTVFPPETDVTVRIRGDTLSAPGIGDDTQGLIVVRDVLRTMVETDLRTQADALFIGTVGEEGLGDLRGVKHLFGPEGPGIDAWISVDGGDESRVKVQAMGSYRYRVTYRGPGGHSAGAFGLVNPHHAAARAVAVFVQEADAFTQSGPRTTFNVGRIGGGTSVNAIPFESWMEVDMRSLDPASLEEIDAIFQAAIRRGLEEENRFRRLGPELDVDVDMVGNRPAAFVDPATSLIQRALAATRVLGVEPTLGSGSTNANTPMSLGVPATTIGRGGQGGGAHSLDEWWLPVDDDVAVKKALLLLLAEAGLDR